MQKAVNSLTSLWCGAIFIQVCSFYTVHQKNEDWKPTVTPVDVEMNLQQGRGEGHNDAKDIGIYVELNPYIYICKAKAPNSNCVQELYCILAFIHDFTEEALLSTQEV